MKLAALALLIHPLLILAPTGLFAATDWGTKAMNNPGGPRLLRSPLRVQFGLGQQRLGLRGPGRHVGIQQARRQPLVARPLQPALGHRVRPGDADQPLRPDHRSAWPSRRAWRRKKPTPITVGTLRTDTITSAASCWARSSWSARCCSCRWRRSDPSPSTSARFRSEVSRRGWHQHRTRLPR